MPTEAQVKAHLAKHTTFSSGCPVCLGKEMALIPGEFTMNGISGNTISVGGPTVPITLIACRACGHLTLFSSLAITKGS